MFIKIMFTTFAALSNEDFKTLFLRCNF